MGQDTRSFESLKRYRRRSEAGVSLLEFTVVLPLLLLLLFGIIEMSLVLYNQAMITNAAREGARFGILFNVVGETYTPHALTEIEAVVDNYLQDHLISFDDSAEWTVTTPTVGNATGDTLTVRVQYPYTFLVLPNLAGAFGSDLTLAAEAAMRME